ncbi:MAG: PDZ domain-containing protein [Pseudomonadota bacterium]
MMTSTATRSLTLSITLGLVSAFAAPEAAAQADREELRDLRDQLAETRRELSDLQRRLNELSVADRRAMPRAPQPPNIFNSQGGGNSLFVSRGERPMIGVVLRSEDRGRGVKLAGVTPDGAADKAGLEADDVLLTLNDEDLTGRGGVELAYDLLDDMEEGDRYRFTYRRDGEEKNAVVEAELTSPSLSFNFSGNGQRPSVGYLGSGDFAFDFGENNLQIDTEALKEWAEKRRDWAVQLNDGRWRQFADNFPGQNNGPVVWNLAMGWSSLKLAELNESLGEYFGVDEGVLVISSGLASADLKGGDVITQVDGTPVTTPGEAMRILTRFDEQESINMTLVRHGATMDVELETPAAGPGDFSFGYWHGEDD